MPGRPHDRRQNVDWAPLYPCTGNRQCASMPFTASMQCLPTCLFQPLKSLFSRHQKVAPCSSCNHAPVLHESPARRTGRAILRDQPHHTPPGKGGIWANRRTCSGCPRPSQITRGLAKAAVDAWDRRPPRQSGRRAVGAAGCYSRPHFIFCAERSAHLLGGIGRIVVGRARLALGGVYPRASGVVVCRHD